MYLYLSSESGFCDTVTPALAQRVSGLQQTQTPRLLVPDLSKTAAAAAPGREHGAYAPSRTSSPRCRSFTRSGAAGTPPVPSPSWWTASVPEPLLCFTPGGLLCCKVDEARLDLVSLMPSLLTKQQLSCDCFIRLEKDFYFNKGI